MYDRKSENFDSIILAGGFGKRLSPLTDTIPKPMLPIAGQSAFIRNLKMLRRFGFNKTAVTTMYLPEQLESVKFEQGRVEYFREEKPLGSAGAVSKLKNEVEDCFLILSGDCICDYDLKMAKEEFLKSNCDAGMILCRTKDSGEYGSVCVRNGRITGFCEKPSVRDTLSDLINTGIYFIRKKVLELIPEDEVFDFAKDLFPLLLQKGYSIAGIEPQGMWFDIGSFGEYHRCNMWMNNAENCIGKHSSIHPNARIEYCVIFDNCTVGNSILRGCIVGEGAVIGNDCIIPPGCVIGPNAEIRDGSSLSPGSIVETGNTVTGEAFVDIFPRPKQTLKFDDDSIIADDGDDGYYVRLGRILGFEGSIIAFAEGGDTTLPKACEIACGVSETGSSCTVISGGNAAVASFSALEYGQNCAFIEYVDGRTEIRLFSKDGMPFSREELRRLSSIAVPKSEKTGNVYLLPHGALVKRYLLALRANRKIPKKINIDSSKENAFFRECAEELGIMIDEKSPIFKLSDNGERVFAILEDGREIPYWQLLMICCIEGRKKGIILPCDTPNTVERILKRHSVDVAFYNDSDSEERRLAGSDRLARDGIILALTSSWIAEQTGLSLGELADKIPPFSVSTRSVFTDRDKMTSIIARLREENGNGRNAGFDFGEGRVSVFASASGRFRLIAEAVDFETAEEISLRAIDMLEKRKNEKK